MSGWNHLNKKLLLVVSKLSQILLVTSLGWKEKPFRWLSDFQLGHQAEPLLSLTNMFTWSWQTQPLPFCLLHRMFTDQTIDVYFSLLADAVCAICCLRRDLGKARWAGAWSLLKMGLYRRYLPRTSHTLLPGKPWWHERLYLLCLFLTLALKD